MSELFIEGQRADVTTDLPALFNFVIDDISEFASRDTSYSWPITLPGTANNNKIFGHIYQPGSSNAYDPAQTNIGANFTALKTASCLIFQNNLQVFKGELQLTKVIEDNGKIEYEAELYGDLGGLKVQLGGKLLEDLDFSAYDCPLTESSITDSWDRKGLVNGSPVNPFPAGTGVYFPLIDYGTFGISNKHDWKIKTFRPALYVFDYLDKIIKGAGFTYDLFTGSDPLLPAEITRFKKMVIPHNQKQLTKMATNLLTATILGSDTPVTVITAAGVKDNTITFAHITSPGSVFTHSFGVFTYAHTAPAATVNISFVIGGYRKNIVTPITLDIRRNGVAIPGHGITLSPNPSTSQIPFAYSTSSPFAISLNPDDTLDFYVNATMSSSDTSYILRVTNANFTVDSQSPVQVPVNYGETISMNEAIPRNIKQVDFLSSLLHLFNMYVVEDRDRKNHLTITPYRYFYSYTSKGADDWTYKIDQHSPKTYALMSLVNAKVYNFNYDTDSDYYNDLYNKRYNQAYGSYKFDTNMNAGGDNKDLKLIFAGTPIIGYLGEDKVYSTIFKLTNNVEETTDSKIRILQTEKLTGLSSWKIYADDGTTALATLTASGWAGHYDNPDAVNNDLNFGVPAELFFKGVAGAISSTQFNVYWSGYMAEIVNKDSKLLTANFHLTARDIYNLDFSKYVIISGVMYRLNQVKDYNITSNDKTSVSLLKVINAIY